jgi:hypothetical protein
MTDACCSSVGIWAESSPTPTTMHATEEESEDTSAAGWRGVMWKRSNLANLRGSNIFCFEPWYLYPAVERLIFWDGGNIIFIAL